MGGSKNIAEVVLNQTTPIPKKMVSPLLHIVWELIGDI